MPNYTKEEIEAFARKDKLNSRMSAIKAISVSYEGTGTSAEDLKEEADKILAWIAQDQVWAGEKQKADVVSDLSFPTPTVDQQKALDKVLAETGKTASQVYAQFKKFPDMTNVDKCIERIKGE